MVAHSTIDRTSARTAYDTAAQEILDHYNGLPVGEQVIALFEQSMIELPDVL